MPGFSSVDGGQDPGDPTQSLMQRPESHGAVCFPNKVLGKTGAAGPGITLRMAVLGPAQPWLLIRVAWEL